MHHLYLCGPMTGLPGHNHAAFHAAAAALRAWGYQVANPAENGLHADTAWEAHMRADIKALMDCSAVAVLDGYEHSRGATLEINIARQLLMPVHGLWYWEAMGIARRYGINAPRMEPHA